MRRARKYKKQIAALLETLTYDYNIRGWMLGARRAYARDAVSTNYFEFDIGYSKTDNNLIGGKAYTWLNTPATSAARYGERRQ